jgi:hypothetical protein
MVTATLVSMSMLTRTQERNRELRRAVEQMLPAMKLTEENLTQVRWHLTSEECEERDLKPFSDLSTGKFVLGPDDMIHLHEPGEQSVGGREHSTAAAPQDSSADEEYDVDGGDNDGERGEDNDGDDLVNDNEQDQDEKRGDAPEVPDDATSDDSQTNEMDNSLDDAYLYIKVIYDLRAVPGISKKWGKVEALPTEVLTCPRDLSLPDIYDNLAEVVEKRLKKQERECYDGLVKGESSLLLKPSLEHDCPVKQRAFDFDDRGISRVAEVNDLLREIMDPETGVLDRDTQPQLTIKLTLIDRVKRAKATHPFIIIKPGAATEKSGGRACLYRIGAQAKPAGPQHAVKISDVLFWYCERGSDPTGVKLVMASSWSLRGLEICNPNDDRIIANNLVELEEADIEGPTTTDQLRDTLKTSDLQPYVGGSLLYNFRVWESDMAPDFNVDPLTEWPGRDITVAVRYISHLKGKEADALRFSLGYEIFCGEKDSHKTLCAAFMRDLRRKNANNALFQSNLIGSWRLELWIMPQIPKGRSLFRFESQAKLMHWLHKPFVAKGDRVLFAEVHLCPVVQKEVVTKSGRKVKKA